VRPRILLLVGIFAIPAGVSGAGRVAAPRPKPKATVAILTGLFDFTDDTYRAIELGAQYRGAGRWWLFHLMGGGMVTFDGAFNVYGGFALEVPLGKRLLVRGGFAPGYYGRGGGKDLGLGLEFRSSLEVAWRLEGGWRVGVELYHISNASLGDTNPGNNSLLLTLTLPVGSRD
jgi:lipid A 3-O-deacylase